LTPFHPTFSFSGYSSTMSDTLPVPNASTDTPSAATPRGEPLRFDYVPRPGLASLCIVNALLGILTLSIYRFWARTNVRKHIWSCVHINGQPLEYTGRGVELFKGALIVFLVLGLPTVLLVAGLHIAYGPEHPAIAGVQFLLFLTVALLWGAALFRARRYQLSRTLWRGIRGGLEGSATTYTLTYFGAMLARGLTFGWSTPVMNYNLQEQMIGGMRFGDMPFSFRGRAGPLYPSYAACWFLTLLVGAGLMVLLGTVIASTVGDNLAVIFGDVPGEQVEPSAEQAWNIAILVAGLVALFVLFGAVYPIIWAFYTAREMSYFANFTKIGGAQFRLNATAGSLILLLIGNLLIWLFTLGIATPYVQQRLIRYLCDRLEVEGTVDVDRILQSKAPLDATGEGLADALDVGGF
jgi:uncharacterized membrane protein YjgN (DUF898 family)